MRMFRSSLLVVVIVGGWLLAACGKSTTPSADSAQASASNPGQAAASRPEPAQASSAGGSTRPFNVTDVFPPGPGREKVLDTCGSCHPVVCSARGQRTAERWESIKEGHKDKLTSLSSADLSTMFSYLKEHFNDTRPEPQIPAELLAPGCTPF